MWVMRRWPLGASLRACPFFFFFNDTATTEIYTLSLHDALPISGPGALPRARRRGGCAREPRPLGDRKSTRLNSSHGYISYAVFCLKKKKQYVLIRSPQSSTTPSTTRHPTHSSHDSSLIEHTSTG